MPPMSPPQSFFCVLINNRNQRQQEQHMKSNGSNSRLSIAEFVEEDPQLDKNKTSFFDPANPELAQAKPIALSKKRNWKRKLFGWGLVLLLIVGGSVLLYSLLRIKQVNVRVQADSQRSNQSSRPEPSPAVTENGLSAEAINIAREAIGTDARPSASPGATPSPSPGAASARVNYSATTNTEIGPVNDFGT